MNSGIETDEGIGIAQVLQKSGSNREFQAKTERPNRRKSHIEAAKEMSVDRQSTPVSPNTKGRACETRTPRCRSEPYSLRSA